jgi:hypothetical protein
MVVIFLVLLDLLHMRTIRLLSPERTRLTTCETTRLTGCKLISAPIELRINQLLLINPFI